MLTLNKKIDRADNIDGELVLRYEQREKSRLRAALRSGEEVALFTARGSVLRDGDLMAGDDGRVIRIVAAAEAVHRIECATPHQLLRCAFHLGNRHTQTQLGAGFLRIRQDPVLKEMLQGLGAAVHEESAAFEPEAGAYFASPGGGGHAHGDAAHPLAPIPLRQRIHRPGDGQD